MSKNIIIDIAYPATGHPLQNPNAAHTPRQTPRPKEPQSDARCMQIGMSLWENSPLGDA